VAEFGPRALRQRRLLPLDRPAAWALRCTAMWDWMTWQSVAQTAWDWGGKIGLGAGAFWLIQRWISQRDKSAERGRALVDAAHPELVPTTNFGGQHSVQVNVRNDGIGPARTLRIAFTGVPEIATVDNVPVGQERVTTPLNVRGSPLFDPAYHGQAEITLIYADRYNNEYRLTIPVTRQPRADGGFNMVIDWHNYKNVPPNLTKKRLREIGGS